MTEQNPPVETPAENPPETPAENSPAHKFEGTDHENVCTRCLLAFEHMIHHTA